MKVEGQKLEVKREQQKRDNDFYNLLQNVSQKQMSMGQVEQIFDRIEKVMKIFLDQKEIDEFETLESQYKQFIDSKMENSIIKNNIQQQIKFFNEVLDERIQRIN